MKLQNLTQIWVCTPKPINNFGEVTNLFIRLRSLYANIQRDYNETDIAEYGQTINEVIKIRTLTVPDIKEFDHIYLSEPAIAETITIGEESLNNYGKGDYVVESIIPSIIGACAICNPTTITARIAMKG